MSWPSVAFSRIAVPLSQSGQYVPASQGVGRGPFPPKQFGGLIEAPGTGNTERGLRVGFRRSNSAASLKLRQQLMLPGEVMTFPPKQFGGLIEA